MNQISQKENACQLKIESIKEAQIAAIVEANCCTCIDHALILLDQNKCLDKVNSFLCTANLNPRCLDIQIYYMLLKYRGRMSQAAAQRIETLCNAHYNSELPNYINLKIPFDPWNYQYCNCPTENHLFNDVSNRLAECITFPERVFSDGNTAEDYREYWEDAFRQLCQTRVMHGMREWRSTVYFHVVLDDAWMIYHLLPDGSTRNAASVFLDYLHLSLAISLRDDTWCGPHSRVYNNEGFSVFEMDQQIYASWVNELIGQDFRAPALVSDYIVPEPIAGLPLRDDSYVSIEKLGPRYYPAGEGEDAFNPNRSNIYLCQSDREDWPGDGILYNQQTPSYVLGSVQDWGTYQGAWHMHCMPWSLTISGAKGINQIISFTGSEKQSDHQGGIMTWPNHSNDQDATLFQHQGTLFSQMRGRRQEKFWEVLHDGDSECAWGGEAGWQKMIGYRAEEEILYSRIYLADELEFFEENQWIFSECQGVSIACRSIRGELIAEASNDWIPGQVLRSEIPDDVILVTVAETAEVGGFDKFRQTICESGRLSWDDKQVSFTDLNGSVRGFSWKEEADPTVNGRVPSYEHIRFEDPLVKSKRGSGIICIDSSDSQCILDAFSPDTMNRRDCPK